MAEKQINRSVRIGNKVYGRGSEAELANVLPKASVRQLVGRGVLSGDWGVSEGDDFDPRTAKKAELVAEAERRGIQVARSGGGDGEPTVEDYRAALSG